MKEGVNSVKRLLNAIEMNIDEGNINQLARLLNYYPRQLAEDISEISSVKIVKKGGAVSDKITYQ